MEPQEIPWVCRVFRKIDLFSSLTIAEVGDLVDHMKKYRFPKNEKVVRQGERGDSFFIIYKGKVGVRIKKGFFGGSRKVGELGPEQFFGEMALLTDDIRTATVVAEEDTDCFVLFKGDFQHLIEKNPAFAEMVKQASQRRAFEQKHRQ